MAHRVVAAVVHQHQLHRDPDQQQPAGQLDERQRQQPGGDGDEREPKPHGAGRAPQPAEELLAARQAAHRERDDQRVVAGQREVDQHDAGQAQPELGVGEGHHH